MVNNSVPVNKNIRCIMNILNKSISKSNERIRTKYALLFNMVK